MNTSPAKDLSILIGLRKPARNIERTLGNHRILFPETFQNAILSPGPSFNYVFDCISNKYVFVSANFNWLLGYQQDTLINQGLQFMHSIIHPDDLSKVLIACKEGWKFVEKQQLELRSQLTIGICFRVRHDEGKYVPILYQTKALGLDCFGNVLSVLGVCSNMSYWDKTNGIRLSVDGPRLHFSKSFNNANYQYASKVTFSKREFEILNLLANGLSSKLIADKLFISVHTVNSHRKNMLDKIGGSNTAALISYGIKHCDL